MRGVQSRLGDKRPEALRKRHAYALARELRRSTYQKEITRIYNNVLTDTYRAQPEPYEQFDTELPKHEGFGRRNPQKVPIQAKQRVCLELSEALKTRNAHAVFNTIIRNKEIVRASKGMVLETIRKHIGGLEHYELMWRDALQSTLEKIERRLCPGFFNELYTAKKEQWDQTLVRTLLASITVPEIADGIRDVIMLDDQGCETAHYGRRMRVDVEKITQHIKGNELDGYFKRQLRMRINRFLLDVAKEYEGAELAVYISPGVFYAPVVLDERDVMEEMRRGWTRAFAINVIHHEDGDSTITLSRLEK